MLARRLRTLTVALLLVSGDLIGASGVAGQRARPVLIGALTESWGPKPAFVGVRDGLQELGYRENEHFTIGVRFTEGDPGALPAAARELVRLGAHMIVAHGGAATKAAQMATDRLPIVFVGGSDPVGLGLVRSFARPGGNVTGVVDLDADLAPKRLEIFRQMVPGLKHVMLPYNAADLHAVSQLQMYRDAARRLGITIVEKAARTHDEAREIIVGFSKSEVDGILSPGVVSLNIPGYVLEAASTRAIPTMFHGAFYVERGGLASYAASDYQSGKQAARLVDRILKGARPGELPVEQPTKFELVINVKAARALKLVVPPALLLRADRLIE
jgi:putative ABC transport system substrate-binding protein